MEYESILVFSVNESAEKQMSQSWKQFWLKCGVRIGTDSIIYEGVSRKTDELGLETAFFRVAHL